MRESTNVNSFTPEHYADMHYKEWYTSSKESAAIMRFFHKFWNDAEARKFFLGNEDVYQAMVEKGVRILGKGLGGNGMKSKAAGFQLFERLAMRYPPGIVLSKELAKAISRMSKDEVEYGFI